MIDIEEKRRRQREYSKKYRMNNIDKVKERDRIYSRKYKKNNPDKVKASEKAYRNTDYGKLVARKSKINYRINHPDRYKATSIISRLIETNKIIRPTHCSICNKHSKLEGHHEDYSKPYEVIWICRNCHMDIHHNRMSKRKDATNANL